MLNAPLFSYAEFPVYFSSLTSPPPRGDILRENLGGEKQAITLQSK